jgi:hypothetical protein
MALPVWQISFKTLFEPKSLPSVGIRNESSFLDNNFKAISQVHASLLYTKFEIRSMVMRATVVWFPHARSAAI